jgi:adenine-specific DNA-methyltransferase
MAGIGDIKAALHKSGARVVSTRGFAKRPPPSIRLDLCFRLLQALQKQCSLSGRYEYILEPIREALIGQPREERHYWVSTFYTLLMDDETKRENATYFTPPYIVRHLIRCAEEAGFDLRKHTALDPAAGGAAFVASLAGRMIGEGCTPDDVRDRLRGIEIDKNLAALAEIHLSHTLTGAYEQSDVLKTIRVGDALLTRGAELYDAVFMNPPFGRLLGGAHLDTEKWNAICDPGHVNKYALFVALALRLVRPGGLIALISPASYIAGPLFSKMREEIRRSTDVIRLDVLDRDNVFFNVQQDAVTAIFRKRAEPRTNRSLFFVSCGRIGRSWRSKEIGTARSADNRFGSAWILPGGLGEHDDIAFVSCPGRLADYNVEIKAGYFVWNREKARLNKKRPKRTESQYPLLWAKNISAGRWCWPASKDGTKVDFVSFEGESTGVIETSAIALQRTTNNKQRRRLLAAIVPSTVIDAYGGFVSENHTILVLPKDGARLDVVCRLLNSAAVDVRYRRIAGTASVSVSSLRDLPLPKPDHLLDALRVADDFEQAVELAYQKSSAPPQLLPQVRAVCQ